MGSGNLTKAGSGLLLLTGGNPFTGVTTVNQGTLEATVTNGGLGGTSGVVIAPGGTVDLAGINVWTVAQAQSGTFVVDISGRLQVGERRHLADGQRHPPGRPYPDRG